MVIALDRCKKRIIMMFSFFMITAGLIISRIFVISIINHDFLKKEYDEQNQISVNVSSNRGNIYDRNMYSFTNINPLYKCAVFSLDDYEKNMKIARQIEQNSDIKAEQLTAKLLQNKVVVVNLKNNYDQALNHISNLKIALFSRRYLKDYPASNTIGYVLNDKGQTGIEKLYNKYLSMGKSTKISAPVDATTKLISKFRINVSDFKTKSLGVVTTLDLKLNRIISDIFRAENVKGAAALLDVNTFDVLALVSSPDFDPENISLYLNSEDGNLLNRAVNSYDMGSIFKIVVLASALENNSINENDLYYCPGKITVSGKGFACHKIDGHGYLTLEQAFAQSCNCAFIEIGQKTGFKNIINMAKKFGVGEKIINPFGFMQSSGTIPDPQNYYLADEANLSIGQGYLSGNVVHGAVLSAVIANKGKINNVNLISHIVDNKGDNVELVKTYMPQNIISQKTADKIYKMMITAVNDGTGQNAYVEKFGSGGKTGTAQTGWYVDGENYQHGWFTGFFPEKNPKYALCVFVENGKSGSTSAAPIFSKIAGEILD